jgi:hypothetical protein
MPSAPARTPRLGEILVARGYCTARQIEEALDEQVVYDGRLGTNLIELGIVTEEQLARALAIQFGRPTRWGPIAIDKSALATMGATGAERWQAVPLKLEGRCLEVLVSELRDPTRLDDLAFATGKEVRPVLVPEARLWELLHRCYGLPYPERRGRIGQRGNEGALVSHQEILADLQTGTGRYVTPPPSRLPSTGSAGSVVPRAVTPTLARGTPVPSRTAPPVLTRVTPAPSAAAIPAPTPAPTRVMAAAPPPVPAVAARAPQAAATDEQPARTRVMPTFTPPSPAAASRTTPPPLPRPSPPPSPRAAGDRAVTPAPAPTVGFDEALATDANLLAEQGHAARQLRSGLPDAAAEQDRLAPAPPAARHP